MLQRRIFPIRFFLTLPLTLIFFLPVGCKDDAVSSEGDFMTAEIDGEKWNATALSGDVFGSPAEHAIIVGSGPGGSITLNVPMDAAPGASHDLASTGFVAVWVDAGTSFPITSGTITLSRINAEGMAGEFSFIGANSGGSSPTEAFVEEGSFSVEFE